ncbi:bacteriocin, partial [Campylobacter vulpis]|nr:bacteriocin [Campylobacter vulpis]MBS4330612.1 bacteriocin [Campylobacter vulpis]
MKRLLNIIALSALLVNFAFANDLLAKLSNDAVSDNSVGVKILSLDEMKEVRG